MNKFHGYIVKREEGLYSCLRYYVFSFCEILGAGIHHRDYVSSTLINSHYSIKKVKIPKKVWTKRTGDWALGLCCSVWTTLPMLLCYEGQGLRWNYKRAQKVRLYYQLGSDSTSLSGWWNEIKSLRHCSTWYFHLNKCAALSGKSQMQRILN